MIFLRWKFGIKICEVWYKINDGEQDTKSCLYEYYCLDEKIPVYKGYRKLDSSDFFTLQTDLTESKEELFNKIEKNTRYEIRRAEKEGASIVFNFSKDLLLNSDTLAQFDEEYVKMYNKKGMNISSIKDRITELAKKENIIITEGKLNNITYAYHVYLLCDKTARLTFSVSNFRENIASNVDKNMIGRLNRWLHYEDMILLKENGFDVYDWGGYDIKENLAGINKFKKYFGGILTKQYNGKTTNSLLLWVIYKLLRGNR
jgi:hypothetical protein